MFQLPYIRFITTKDKWGSKMKKQVTDLYHHLCPRYGTPTGFEYSSRRSDNTQSGIPQVTTHSPALFPLALSQHFINTVTFRNSRPFVKICWLSPRIAHLKHTPKLSVHLFPNPRVSSMGWLPRPEPRLTAGGDTWNTKTKLTLSTLASPGVWQRKCGSPIQCQRLWPGNID